MRQSPFYCDWKTCVLIEKYVQYEVNTTLCLKVMTEKLKLYQLFYIRHRQSSKKVIRTLQSPKSLAMSEFSNTSESYNWCLGDHKVTLDE